MKLKQAVSVTDEVTTTAGFEAFLANAAQAKVVLRVPAAPGTITEAEQRRIDDESAFFGRLETRLMEMGFSVRDRGLLASVVARSGSSDFAAIRNQIDTDLIIEITKLEFSSRDYGCDDVDSSCPSAPINIYDEIRKVSNLDQSTLLSASPSWKFDDDGRLVMTTDEALNTVLQGESMVGYYRDRGGVHGYEWNYSHRCSVTEDYGAVSFRITLVEKGELAAVGVLRVVSPERNASGEIPVSCERDVTTTRGKLRCHPGELCSAAMRQLQNDRAMTNFQLSKTTFSESLSVTSNGKRNTLDVKRALMDKLIRFMVGKPGSRHAAPVRQLVERQ